MTRLLLLTPHRATFFSHLQLHVFVLAELWVHELDRAGHRLLDFGDGAAFNERQHRELVCNDTSRRADAVVEGLLERPQNILTHNEHVKNQTLHVNHNKFLPSDGF